MAQPLLVELKKSGATLHVLAPDWVAPVARRMPEVDEVIAVPFRHGAADLRSRWRLARALAKRGYDRAIVLPNSWKSALVPFLAGEMRYGLLNSTLPNSKLPMPVHYARLAGGEPAQPLPQPHLVVSPDEVVQTRNRFGIEQRYAVLCPGAEYGPAKRWPYFGELAQRIGMPVVILGSANDREAAAGIPGKDLAGRTTLDEAIVLIAGAAVVVSNDSGLMHVAAALRRPQVALFGSSSPEHTPPASDKARVVWLHIECSPCFARECPLGHFRCMKEMTVERVLAEVNHS